MHSVPTSRSRACRQTSNKLLLELKDRQSCSLRGLPRLPGSVMTCRLQAVYMGQFTLCGMLHIRADGSRESEQEQQTRKGQRVVVPWGQLYGSLRTLWEMHDMHDWRCAYPGLQRDGSAGPIIVDIGFTAGDACGIRRSHTPGWPLCPAFTRHPEAEALTLSLRSWCPEYTAKSYVIPGRAEYNKHHLEYVRWQSPQTPHLGIALKLAKKKHLCTLAMHRPNRWGN